MGRPRKLTTERIIIEALALLDAEGAQALTMQRISGRLGVRVMTLYSYFDGRAALRAAMVDHVLRRMDPPVGAPLPWRAALEQNSRAFRRCLLAHPHIIALFGDPGLSRSSVWPHVQTGIDLLVAAGLDVRTSIAAYLTVYNFINGYVQWEVPRFHAEGHLEYGRQMRDGMADFGFPPEVAAAWGTDVAERSPDDMFDERLALILDGIEARVRGARSSGRPGSAPRRSRR